MDWRPYDPTRDREACIRIWREVGWLETGHEADFPARLGHALVALIDDQPECLVIASPGELTHGTTNLPLALVAGVTTSRIARKQRLASRLTARLVAEEAAAGAPVAALGMFEQGFYDRLGFGSAAYDDDFRFDPALLAVEVPERVPVRLTKDDYAELHAAMLGARRPHGTVRLLPVEFTRAELNFDHDGWGLGFRDAPGDRLSHFFWCSKLNGENGPLSISMMAYRTGAEFRELLGVVRGLADQVRSVRLREPGGVQLQDLFQQPFRNAGVRSGSPHSMDHHAFAWWQLRICDVKRCLDHLSVAGEQDFNLTVTDPITDFLDETSPWPGAAGEFTVKLGPQTVVSDGHTAGRPELTCSINALSRWWFGVQPASGLAITDDFSAPTALLTALDRLVCLPVPKAGMGF